MIRASGASRSAPQGRGFTLLEVAIVLAILTVLLASVATSLSGLIEQRQRSDAQRQLERVKEAVIGYAITQRRLPRPARSANDGTERADCASDAECTGLLPWATLGLERLDPWGKVIRYSASKELAKAGAVLTIGGSTSSATKQIYSSSRLTTASGDVAVSVAVVAWSQGARNFGTSEAGTALPNGSTTNVDEQANDQGTAAGRPAGTGFVSRTPTSATDARDKAGNPVGEFDDVVTWIPVGTLVARMVQAGRLP